MTPFAKDRLPGSAGCRSFLKRICSVLFLALALLAWRGAQLALVIEPEDDRHHMLCMPTQAGKEFYISLTHSVEKTTWNDYFIVRGERNLLLTHTIFESLGWGFPYGEESGSITRTNDNKFSLTVNRKYTSLPLRISEQSRQKLVYDDKTYDLIDLYGQGTALRISVMRRYQCWIK